MPPRVADTGLITASSLTIMAAMAVVTILGILWGMRLKRARREADRIEAARIEEEAPLDHDPVRSQRQDQAL